MIFTRNLYKKARKHWIARAVEFREMRNRAHYNPSFRDPQIANRYYREAASMARKIVERANREKGMYKYAVGKK